MNISPQQLAQEVEALFSLPDVALRLNELIDRPDTSIHDLVEVVQLVDMRDFWDNSVTCGVVTRNLAQKMGMRESERMFLAGLLHKVGRLAFYSSRPVQYRQVLQERSNGEAAIIEAEEAVFGFNYAQLGAALLRAWRVPAALDEVVEYQLDPLRAPNQPVESAIVHVAGDIAFHMAPDIKARFQLGEYNLTFRESAWEALNLERSVLAEVMQNSLIQSFELLEIINPRAPMIL